MNNIKIEIKKSEVNIIKEALNDCAALYHHDSWIGLSEDDYEKMVCGINGGDAYRSKIELELKHYPYSKLYKISQLKKLAMIEHRIVTAQVKKGWLKKTLGNLRCWWRWTTSDENWRTTKFGTESLKNNEI